MTKYLKSKTSLFLMELIITILLFAACGAVCVKLFVTSYVMTKETVELNEAVSIAQGFAEVMRGTNGDIDSVIEHYPEAVRGDAGFFEVFYDEEFEPCEYGEAVYVSDVTMTPNGAIQNMEVRIVRLSDYRDIYTLNVTKYMNKTKG
ncbi:MAG: hypothetical protein IJ821_01270 [Lachnospiraceae bacterium]|nr:hypothetical protein [Lachnospiraceae bacterium]